MPGPRYAFVGDVHLSYWAREANEDDVLEFRQSLQNRRCSLLLVIGASVGLSTSGARKQAAKLVEDMGADLFAIGIVVEGEGFWRAGIRAMFTGISFLTKPLSPWRVFDSFETSLDWISDETHRRGGQVPDISDLADKLHRLRSL